MYALLLALCLVFYWAYREWMAFFLLMLAVGLPWLSLLCSLVAARKLVLTVQCPAPAVDKGTVTWAKGLCSCPLPPPPVRSRLELRESISGERRRYEAEEPLPTVHCTRLRIDVRRAWYYDYLGLFRIRLRRCQGTALLVRPVPIAVSDPPDLSAYLSSSFKPKPGGGFAENHELRLYRPGDNLNQVHWKLSAKTGKLILREPMEPLRGLALLTLTLRGTAEQIDSKLGRLLWMSRYLLSNQISHRIQCLTGSGMQGYAVTDEKTLWQAMDAILAEGADRSAATPVFMAAAWHFHIGGDGGEV